MTYSPKSREFFIERLERSLQNNDVEEVRDLYELTEDPENWNDVYIHYIEKAMEYPLIHMKAQKNYPSSLTEPWDPRDPEQADKLRQKALIFYEHLLDHFFFNNPEADDELLVRIQNVEPPLKKRPYMWTGFLEKRFRAANPLPPSPLGRKITAAGDQATTPAPPEGWKDSMSWDWRTVMTLIFKGREMERKDPLKFSVEMKEKMKMLKEARKMFERMDKEEDAEIREEAALARAFRDKDGEVRREIWAFSKWAGMEERWWKRQDSFRDMVRTQGKQMVERRTSRVGVDGDEEVESEDESDEGGKRGRKRSWDEDSDSDSDSGSGSEDEGHDRKKTKLRHSEAQSPDPSDTPSENLVVATHCPDYHADAQALLEHLMRGGEPPVCGGVPGIPKETRKRSRSDSEDEEDEEDEERDSKRTKRGDCVVQSEDEDADDEGEVLWEKVRRGGKVEYNRRSV